MRTVSGRKQPLCERTACALELKPQTILVSIGNNDALQALTLGIPPTNTGTFAEEYVAFLAGLSATHAHIVVSNIPDVTAIPFLVPVPAFEAVCGFWLAPSCHRSGLRGSKY